MKFKLIGFKPIHSKKNNKDYVKCTFIYEVADYGLESYNLFCDAEKFKDTKFELNHTYTCSFNPNGMLEGLIY